MYISYFLSVNYTIYINIVPSIKGHSKNYIGNSCVGGRGVFAGKSYKPKEIIEIAYGVKDNPGSKKYIKLYQKLCF